ncbi:hypothetical protein TI39_contig74g00001, partial [Zymoseptoria brevis]
MTTQSHSMPWSVASNPGGRAGWIPRSGYPAPGALAYKANAGPSVYRDFPHAPLLSKAIYTKQHLTPLLKMQLSGLLTTLAMVAATNAAAADLFAIGATAMTLLGTCNAVPSPINIPHPLHGAAAKLSSRAPHFYRLGLRDHSQCYQRRGGI